jgi:flagellin
MASNDLSRINTNIQAMNALNALNNVNSKMGVHQMRLATGKRINSAADDAAGFTIASKLNVKSKGLGTALDNIGSAKNLMTVAEGHLSNIKDILSEMKSKAQQAANGTLGTEERAAILEELTQFNNQIDAEVSQAKWADTSLLDGTSISFQIGTGTSSSDALAFDVLGSVSGITGFTSSGLSVDATATATLSNETALATTNMVGGAAFGTVSTIGSGLTELGTGHYTVTVDYTTNATAATVNIQLLDSSGSAVTIDGDGNTGGASGTTLSTTGTGTNLGSIDLGNGLSIDLGDIATSSSGNAVFTLDYSQGNSVDSQTNAQAFMGQIDTAINKVAEGLSYVGSTINRLDFQEESLTVAKTNTDAAHSRIVDADMAWEQLEATKMMILQQTATAMLSQANTAPQSVLSLFG